MKFVKSINQCKSAIQTTYDIVKARRGKISLETRQGEGTVFVIQLPLA